MKGVQIYHSRRCTENVQTNTHGPTRSGLPTNSVAKSSFDGMVDIPSIYIKPIRLIQINYY